MDEVIAESNEDNNSGAFTLSIQWGAPAAKYIGPGELDPDVMPPVDMASQLYDPELNALDDFIQAF